MDRNEELPQVMAEFSFSKKHQKLPKNWWFFYLSKLGDTVNNGQVHYYRREYHPFL